MKILQTLLSSSINKKNDMIFYFAGIDCFVNDKKYEKLLSSYELDLANSKSNSLEGNLYIKQRLILRSIIAYFSGIELTEVKIDFTSAKPKCLLNNIHDFNISHSDNTMAVVLSNQSRCGIDVEFIRSLKYKDKIMKRFFSFDEIAVINRSIDAKSEFFRHWTLKEASVKCFSKGMYGNAKNYNIVADRVVCIEDNENIYCKTMQLKNGFLSVAFAEKVHEISFVSYDFAKDYCGGVMIYL